MSDDVLHHDRNRATEAELLAHLRAADAGFVPALSARVDLYAYAAKLHARAERFEAWAGPALVGLVAAYCNAGSAFVSSVSVLPPWQGRGLARQLMLHCLDFARAQGLSGMALEVDARAAAALALYRRLGFSERARRGTTLDLRLELA